VNPTDRAYNCDRCEQHTPDGDGIHYKGERFCADCAEVVAFWQTIDEACPNCGDAMSETASNLQPVWSDSHDDIVCWWCANHPTKSEVTA